MTRKTDASTPEQLRESIEGTREQLGATVAALAAKADVKSRVKGTASDAGQQVRDKAGQAVAATKSTVAAALHTARDKTPDPVLDASHKVGHQLAATASTAAGAAREHTPDSVADKARQAASATRENRVRAAVIAALVIAAVVYRIRTKAT